MSVSNQSSGSSAQLPPPLPPELGEIAPSANFEPPVPVGWSEGHKLWKPPNISIIACADIDILAWCATLTRRRCGAGGLMVASSSVIRPAVPRHTSKRLAGPRLAKTQQHALSGSGGQLTAAMA